jgi:DNA-binding NarL/FixJ family response regulator
MDLVTHPSAPAREPIRFSTDEHLAGQYEGEVPRILIVEDDYVVGLELENALSEAGFGVVGTANSAEEAVRLAISERPILAVMDIRLAGRRDGIEAALEMFNACGVRCIFATAHHDARTRARAAKAAPLGWLPKPYQLDGLISMIYAAVTELKKSRS